MFLGVHTPADVLVSAAIAVILVFALYPIINCIKNNPKGMRVLLSIMAVWCIAQVIFMELFPFPSDSDAEQIFSGLKNAYKMLGAVFGVFIVYELDLRYIKFETKAVWWAQIIKLVLGIALTLGVKELCYMVFGLLPYEVCGRAFSYFFMVIFAGCVWPLTFKYFGKLGGKN